MDPEPVGPQLESNNAINWPSPVSSAFGPGQFPKDKNFDRTPEPAQNRNLFANS